jgi:hypothetical protein
MSSVELLLPDGKPSAVWMCRECRLIRTRTHQPIADGSGRTYTPKERDEFARLEAEACCTEAQCARCTAGLGRKVKHGGHMLCNECQSIRQAEQEAARFEKAAKLTEAEFIKSNAAENMLYDERHDHWFRDLDDAEEWYADDEERERPAYLWCTEPVGREPDFAGHVGSLLAENFHDDADEQIPEDAWKELAAFEQKWWGDYSPTSFEINYSRCVLLNAEGSAEIPFAEHG